MRRPPQYRQGPSACLARIERPNPNRGLPIRLGGFQQLRGRVHGIESPRDIDAVSPSAIRGRAPLRELGVDTRRARRRVPTGSDVGPA